jgi:hypothetical protein
VAYQLKERKGAGHKTIPDIKMAMQNVVYAPTLAISPKLVNYRTVEYDKIDFSGLLFLYSSRNRKF